MNEYLYCYKTDPVISLQPLVGCNTGLEQGDYFEMLLREFDRLTTDLDIKVFLTWNLDHLKVTGPRVVTIMVGDERCLVPPDADKVRAIFRTGTQALNVGELLRLRMGFLERVLDWGRFALKVCARLQRWRRGTARLRAPAHVFAIPLPPFRGAPTLPLAPIVKRSWDMSFLGTVGTSRLIAGRRVPLSPKAAARLAMLAAVRIIQRQLPQVRISIGCELQPDWPHMLTTEAYAEVLRDTKISLCPRGNFAETFRLTESARAGCVVITDPLPKEWYFDGHPFVEIANWKDLPKVVTALVADPVRLTELSVQSLSWWKCRLAPEAVAAYMTGQLDALLRKSNVA